MAESEIKMSRFGRVFGAFKPNNVLGSKNPCESEYLNFANKSRKKNGCKRSRCWETDINPLNPNVKIEILICYLYTFSIEVVGRIC